MKTNRANQLELRMLALALAAAAGLGSCVTGDPIRESPVREEGEWGQALREGPEQFRDCVPYVEPEPGEASAGFSVVSATTVEAASYDIWIHVAQQGFRGKGAAPLMVGEKGRGGLRLAADTNYLLRMTWDAEAESYVIQRYQAHYGGDGAVDVEESKNYKIAGVYSASHSSILGMTDRPFIDCRRYRDRANGDNGHAEIRVIVADLENSTGSLRIAFDAY